MTKEKAARPKGWKKPDEIQRQIWHYRRVWVSVLVLLVAGRFLAPHLRSLRGWEQKFTLASVEIGKEEIPSGAKSISSTEEAIEVLKPDLKIDSRVIHLEGPIMVAAWRCMVLSEPGGCVRYIWKGQPLTLVILPQPKNKSEVSDPFTKSGWSGYFVVHDRTAFALVGTIETDDIKSAWPYASQVAALSYPKK